MEQVLEAIRAATAPDASAEVRAAGAQACRALADVLEPQPAAAPPELQLPIAQLATAIRTVPLDQLLDLAIAKLRSALPAEAAAPTVPPLNFRLVPVQRKS
jgi:hypothetical protein